MYSNQNMAKLIDIIQCKTTNFSEISNQMLVEKEIDIQNTAQMILLLSFYWCFKKYVSEVIMEKGLNIADFTLLSSIIQDNRIEGIYKSECDFISSPVFFIKRRDEYNNLVCDCGKGLTVQNAFLSAFYEMIERCSAEKFEGRSFAMVEGEKHNLISESFERYGIRRVCSGKNILNGSFVTLPLDAVKFPLN